MGKRPDITARHIVLTARCNLQCAYCFENSKNQGRMDWSVVRACLDFGLNTRETEIEFIFSGGEPLLEMPLIRRAVAYTERHSPPHLEVKHSVLTNGTLLDESTISFLVENHLEVQISFDGIPESQDLRSPGSFSMLDGWLDYLRAHHSTYYRRRCAIAAVVGPDSLANLPRSVDYFLSKRVPTLILAPDYTDTHEWRKSDIDRLDGVFAELCDNSRRHYDKTGEIPMRMFRSPPRAPRVGSHGRALCGIMRGQKPAVDPSGRVFGCGAVVSSYQQVPSVPVRSCLQHIRLGHIADPHLPERLADYRRVVRQVGLFDNKQRNRSSYSRCGECERLAHCSICPVSIGYIPDNEDLDRVPDFLCAYNLVALKYRERFWAQSRKTQGGMT
jgi:uncharacterized protein